MSPYRIVIWGAGSIYSSVAENIFTLVQKGQGEVLGIMADSLPPSGTLDGFPILPKDALRSLEFDYLLYCVGGEATEGIQDISKTYGVPREKIINSTVMHLVPFDFERYMRLRESNITIVSDLCWGGFIYKKLDLRCMSPFRNVYITNREYLRMLGDLRGYCSMELVHAGFEPGNGGTMRPVMRLGDVGIHFNHVKTPEEAASQWYARVGRINWGNLFIMMSTSLEKYEHAFNQLEGFDKKICFVPYETSEPYSLHLHMRPQDSHFFETVNATGALLSSGYPFDPVMMLLGEPDFERYKPEGGRHA